MAKVILLPLLTHEIIMVSNLNANSLTLKTILRVVFWMRGGCS